MRETDGVTNFCIFLPEQARPDHKREGERRPTATAGPLIFPSSARLDACIKSLLTLSLSLSLPALHLHTACVFEATLLCSTLDRPLSLNNFPTGTILVVFYFIIFLTRTILVFGSRVNILLSSYLSLICLHTNVSNTKTCLSLVQLLPYFKKGFW